MKNRTKFLKTVGVQKLYFKDFVRSFTGFSDLKHVFVFPVTEKVLGIEEQTEHPGIEDVGLFYYVHMDSLGVYVDIENQIFQNQVQIEVARCDFSRKKLNAASFFKTSLSLNRWQQTRVELQFPYQVRRNNLVFKIQSNTCESNVYFIQRSIFEEYVRKNVQKLLQMSWGPSD